MPFGAFFLQRVSGIGSVNAEQRRKLGGTETAEDGYHGKANICFLEGRAVIGSISRHCYHLSGFTHRAVNDT